MIFAAIVLNLLFEVMGDNTGSPAAARNPALVYSRHDLLKLRDVNNHSWAAEIPADIRPRKRGKRRVGAYDAVLEGGGDVCPYPRS